ncbi:MAG: hypothetical protein ACTHJ4_06665 [Candidatus Nucleicultricaceae bacterium]
MNSSSKLSFLTYFLLTINFHSPSIASTILDPDDEIQQTKAVLQSKRDERALLQSAQDELLKHLEACKSLRTRKHDEAKDVLPVFDQTMPTLSQLNDLNFHAGSYGNTAKRALEEIARPLARGLFYNPAQWRILAPESWWTQVGNLLENNTAFQHLYVYYFSAVCFPSETAKLRLSTLHNNLKTLESSGNSHVLTMLGLIHEYGLEGQTDKQKARQYFLAAANKGDRDGAYHWARSHDNEQERTDHDQEITEKYTFASGKDHLKAKTALARHMLKDNSPKTLSPEHQKSIVNLLKGAALGGDDEAQILLCKMFKEDLFVEVETGTSGADLITHYEKGLAYAKQAEAQGAAEAPALKSLLPKAYRSIS